MKENHKILIDPTEFQSLVLDYINSEEFNKMIDASVFIGDPTYKSAIIHGMTIASMLTCRCQRYDVVELKNTDERVNYDINDPTNIKLSDLMNIRPIEFIIDDNGTILCLSEFGKLILNIPTYDEKLLFKIPSMVDDTDIIKIGSNAFAHIFIDMKPVSIILPNTIINIGEWSFRGCNSIESITIPTSVEVIEDAAFHGCNSLTTVNYEGTEEEWNNIEIGKSNSVLSDATINFNYKE